MTRSRGRLPLQPTNEGRFIDGEVIYTHLPPGYPEFDAQGISIPEDKRNAASREMAQKSVEMRTQAAAKAAPAADSPAATPAAPAAPPAAPPANAGPLKAPKSLDAPDSLR